MNTIKIQYYQSPAGEMILGSSENRLCICDWVQGWHRNSTEKRVLNGLNAEYQFIESDISNRAASQLDEYFAQKRIAFDIPLLFIGTEFQKKVWNKLLEIPYGKTISYAEMARQLGCPKSYRALANANGANAISIFAPCHRVIGSDNKLGGYGGGLDAKRLLLDLENSFSQKIVLETNRLYIRHLTLDDIPDLSLVLSDEESMRHYPHPFSAKEVKEWIERNIKRYNNDGFGLWAVIRKADNQFLGDCGITLQNIDGEILPEIGYHIIKYYCNKGYATEAAEACKKFALDVFGYKSIYSYSEIGNIASQRVASKIGMKELKRFKRDGAEEIVFEYKLNNI